ncbi:hypothetical protein X975_22742, partial [Stegodyphus mimosarum]
MFKASPRSTTCSSVDDSQQSLVFAANLPHFAGVVVSLAIIRTNWPHNGFTSRGTLASGNSIPVNITFLSWPTLQILTRIGT